jgi:hypothetical protein
MRRMFVFGIATLATTAATFAISSHALGSGPPPNLRSNLPATQLPTTALAEEESIAVNDLIGPEAAAQFGITSDSYRQARLLSNTAAGQLYLIPGSSGACLAMPAAVSCGDPGADGQPILALMKDSSGDFVGGGIADDSTKNVTITSPNGPPASIDVDRGVFLVTSANRIKAQRGVEVNVDGGTQ